MKRILLITISIVCIRMTYAQVPMITPITMSPTSVMAEPLSIAPVGTPTTDAGLHFLIKLKGIEDQMYHYNSLIRATESVQFMVAQLQSLQEQKEKLQKVYNLQEDIRNDLKKVKALKDFGIADVLYLSEQILGESLNPADYMISTDWEFHEDLKRAVSYRPSSNISSDARAVYKFLTRYREGDTLQIQRFNEIADVLGFERGWRDYTRQQQIVAGLAQIRSSDLLLERLQGYMDMTITKDTLSMSDGERLGLMIKYTEMMGKAQNDKLQAAKLIEGVVKEEKEERLRRLRRMTKEASQQRAFRKIVYVNYNKNKGFRLADYAVRKEAAPRLKNKGMYRVR